MNYLMFKIPEELRKNICVDGRTGKMASGDVSIL